VCATMGELILEVQVQLLFENLAVCGATMMKDTILFLCELQWVRERNKSITEERFKHKC
jgi:hypothetical protein